MGTTMNFSIVFPNFLLPLLATLFATIFAAENMYPFICTQHIQTCKALLYQINTDTPKKQMASLYYVNESGITTIKHVNKHDYLITVPCSCKEINGTRAYFYETIYTVKEGDTFFDVSNKLYNGQAWFSGNEDKLFDTLGNNVSMHLLCGCVENESQLVVTYTVEKNDILSEIATLLSARINGIESINKLLLTQNPGFIDIGWVLFVPMEKNGIPPPKGKKHEWPIVVGILSAVTILSIIALIIILLRKKIPQRCIEEDPKSVSRTLSTNRTASLQNHYMFNENMEAFDSERPVIFSVGEIEEATCNFDETKIVGEGGYGSVYFGMLGEPKREVAVKKMRSNKTKEFVAELKVLCKIHHINVVELLGFASGDDHLFLVYEYVSSGSLSDHLHDPLLKGHQPLSWTARAQIALDSAKGIEYIHDHTKAQCVHRDIKTTNILLDEGLRAKVADFGLAKLVERTNEDDCIATKLVGTPGYLPPESLRELQVTTKTDVFAFGVVLAELITGQRALARDNREPNKMKSLITLISKVFQDEDPESALEDVIDLNLRSSYPMEDIYKMAELAMWCLSEEAIDRPEMHEIVINLSQLVKSSVEWEALLGGSGQIFSGLLDGR